MKKQRDGDISVSAEFYKRITEDAPRLKSNGHIRPGWLRSRLNLAINRAHDEAERNLVTSP
jgi:hypothetical protein